MFDFFKKNNKLLKKLTDKQQNFIYFFAITSLIHLYFIIKNSVNIPYMDEWELFRENSFLFNPSLTSLFEQHNEHKLVIPKLFFYVYMLLGFNIKNLQIFNFLYFILLVVTYFKFSNLFSNKLLLFIITLGLLSPLNFENHFWPFQIQWHLVLLFIIVSCHTIQKEKKNYLDLILAAVLPFLTIFSLGSGLVASFILLIFVLFNLLKEIKKKNVISLVFNLLYSLSTLFSVFLYLNSYSKPQNHPNLVFPYKFEFWQHFMSILSLGIGNFENTSTYLGILVLLYSIVILTTILINKIVLDKFQKFLFVFLTILGAMLATISLSRAGFGYEQGLSSRYFEFSIFYFSSAITLGLSLKLKYINVFSKLLLFIFFILIIKNYNFEKFYYPLNIQRSKGKECINLILQKKIGDICADIYPSGLKELILKLKDNNRKIDFIEN